MTSEMSPRLTLELGVSQQAVARAERWASNPAVRFITRWAGSGAKKRAEDPECEVELGRLDRALAAKAAEMPEAARSGVTF